jgi:lipid-A-disaccharide synthase
VGGPLMEKEGLSSLFPMQELSLLGFVEIIPKIPHIFKRLNELETFISEHKPDCVITIDVPGFSYRLLKRLKGKGIKLIHYVAPTVWVWRESRAKKWAQVADNILTLFPFEPAYFEKYGGKATFVGHPLLETSILSEKPDLFKQKYKINTQDYVLVMLPGSRQSELKTLVPIFKEVILYLKEKIPHLVIVIPAVDQFYAELSESFKNVKVPCHVVSSDEKYQAMASGHLGLVASGTVTLEVALVGLPMVVTYKVNPLTAWLIKQLIKVPYVSLVNLLLQKKAVPELLQENCKVSHIAEALLSLYQHQNERDAQKPSEKAAETILTALSN